MFRGIHLEPVGELCEESERSRKGYQDEGQDSVYRKSGMIKVYGVFDDLTGRFGKSLRGAHGCLPALRCIWPAQTRRKTTSTFVEQTPNLNLSPGGRLHVSISLLL